MKYRKVEPLPDEDLDGCLWACILVLIFFGAVTCGGCFAFKTPGGGVAHGEPVAMPPGASGTTDIWAMIGAALAAALSGTTYYLRHRRRHARIDPPATATGDDDNGLRDRGGDAQAG